MSDVVRIKRISQESKDTSTLAFDWGAHTVPGQFIMVWIPGIDEIPMSLSSTGSEKTVTVRKVGDATSAIHALQEGDRIGVRGPYGNGFDLNGLRTLVVGGGVGMAPLMPVLRTVYADLVIGARTADEILFEEEARRYCSNVEISTDDGSLGFHGNAVQLAEAMMDKGDYEQVIACGPEVMLHYLFQACERRGLPCQLSLERYMKCAVGICGSCMLGRERVCIDGPVFDSERLRMLPEFGRSRRDPAGRIVDL